MKCLIRILGLIVLVLGAPLAAHAAQVIASPQTITVPYGQTSSFTVTYRYSGAGGAPATCLVQSLPGGVLRSETTSQPLINTVSIVATKSGRAGDYNGIGTETITLTAAQIERARREGQLRFIVDRSFQDCNGVDFFVDVTVRVTGAAAADFNVNRIELYFKNRRPEITVERNEPKLKAYADIRYTGSGLLEGYWEVDGRVLAREVRHLTYGRSVTLESPDAPPLPTFNEGSHVVRFVITKPEPSLTLPLIVYFVTPQDARLRSLPVVLRTPIEGGFVSSPITFTWEGSGPSLYLVSFYEQKDGTPVFSAFVREPQYLMPVAVLPMSFHKGRTYWWKVSGFSDGEPAAMGESTMRSFFLKE